MDVLEKIQSGITELVGRLEVLNKDKVRLEAEISMLADERNKLVDANASMQAALENERSLRQEALGRIDALLTRLESHDCAG